MDLAIFTGRITEEALRNARPAEYARLVKTAALCAGWCRTDEAESNLTGWRRDRDAERRVLHIRTAVRLARAAHEPVSRDRVLLCGARVFCLRTVTHSSRSHHRAAAPEGGPRRARLADDRPERTAPALDRDDGARADD